MRPYIMEWRLILDGAQAGAWNMARDEALLRSADASTAPALRFYHWNPACVSIGRLQKLNSQFSILNSPFPFVRRPTGGRAVLHQHEITYSAIVHKSRLPRESHSVVGAYNWLSAGFLEGLKSLGVRAQLSPARSASTPLAANCFQSAAQCDFLVDGKKLIGASQCRSNDVILQHGAILLKVDEIAWREAVGGAMEGATSLRELGVLASREAIIAALIGGLERAWNISLQPSRLSKAEMQMASLLHAHKYSTVEWNQSGLEPAVMAART